MKHYVYTLAYPESMGGAVFYVGKGMGKRIDQHELEAQRENPVNPYKCNVIRNIWASGEQVVKTKLAHFDTHEEAIQYEIALIFFMDGLTNLTYGGDGNVGWIPSEDTRRKLGEARKVHWLSDEYRQKMIDGRKGRKLSEEARHKISEGHKGIKHTEEEKRKISEANKGRIAPHKGTPHTEEAKRKMSEAHKTSPLAKESRRKTAEARRGCKRPPRSEEWSRNIREALKKRAAFDPRFQ